MLNFCRAMLLVAIWEWGELSLSGQILVHHTNQRLVSTNKSALPKKKSIQYNCNIEYKLITGSFF